MDNHEDEVLNVDLETKDDALNDAPAPAPATLSDPDEAWQRRSRRETALHAAIGTLGKHAKPEKVLETARVYLDFIEG